MFKKGISVLMSVILTAASIFSSASVFAEGTTEVGGATISTLTFVDDFENLNNVYSFDCQDGNWLAEPMTSVGSTNITGYRLIPEDFYTSTDSNIGNQSVPADVVFWYKAADGKSFTSVKYVIWYNDSKYDAGYRPVIKVKDSNGTITALENVTWTRITKGSADTKWNSQIMGTASILQGSEYVGLGFSGKGITCSQMAVDKAEFTLGSEISESFFADDCKNMENTWARTNLEAISGVVGTADYGVDYMWRQITGSKPYEAVYKAADGRNITTFSAQISAQGSSNLPSFPILAYSFDGITWTDLTVSTYSASSKWKHDDWDVGSAAGSSGNAKYAKVSTTKPAEVILPEGVKFVKLYSTTGTNQAYLYFRYVKFATTPENEISENSVIDDMSDNEKMWRMSNVWAYNKMNAANAATFNDKTIMGIPYKSTESYITYKADETRAFTGFTVTAYTRDGGTAPDIKVSVDGKEWTTIATASDFEKLEDGGSAENTDGKYSAKMAVTKSLDFSQAYKYIKIYDSGESALTKVKYGDITLKTLVLPEYRTIEPGYAEVFADMGNICDSKNFHKPESGSIFAVTNAAASAEPAETEAYITYQLADNKKFKYAKFVFGQVNDNTKRAKVIALDKDMKELEWDQTGLWTEKSGTVKTFTLKGELPENTKYIKLLTNYIAADWQSRITEVRFYEEPINVTKTLYQVADGIATKIDELPASGSNVKGTVSFCNPDLEDKDIWVFGVLRENNNLLKMVQLNSTELTEEGTVTLETPVLEGCEITDNTSFEIIVLEKDTLAPVLPAKVVFN